MLIQMRRSNDELQIRRMMPSDAPDDAETNVEIVAPAG